ALPPLQRGTRVARFRAGSFCRFRCHAGNEQITPLFLAHDAGPLLRFPPVAHPPYGGRPVVSLRASVPCRRFRQSSVAPRTDLRNHPGTPDDLDVIDGSGKIIGRIFKPGGGSETGMWPLAVVGARRRRAGLQPLVERQEIARAKSVPPCFPREGSGTGVRSADPFQGSGTAVRLPGTICGWKATTSRLRSSTSTFSQCTSLLPFWALSPNVSTRTKFSSRWPCASRKGLSTRK